MVSPQSDPKGQMARVLEPDGVETLTGSCYPVFSYSSGLFFHMLMSQRGF